MGNLLKSSRKLTHSPNYYGTFSGEKTSGSFEAFIHSDIPINTFSVNGEILMNFSEKSELFSKCRARAKFSGDAVLGQTEGNNPICISGNSWVIEIQEWKPHDTTAMGTFNVNNARIQDTGSFTISKVPQPLIRSQV